MASRASNDPLLDRGEDRVLTAPCWHCGRSFNYKPGKSVTWHCPWCLGAFHATDFVLQWYGGGPDEEKWDSSAGNG